MSGSQVTRGQPKAACKGRTWDLPDRRLEHDPLPFGVEPELDPTVTFALDPEEGRFEPLPTTP